MGGGARRAAAATRSAVRRCSATTASPHGRTTAPRLAFSSDRGTGIESGHYNIWILDTRTGALRQVTKSQGESYMPTWSPSDDEIAFISTRGSGPTALPGIGARRKQRVGGRSWPMGRSSECRPRAFAPTRQAPADPGGQGDLSLDRHQREVSISSTASISPGKRTCFRSARRGFRRRISSTCPTARFVAARWAATRRRRSSSRRR